ncbi:MAG: BBP7 family outer membrane beta-barrel protein [Pirellulaceae bacterium]
MKSTKLSVTLALLGLVVCQQLANGQNYYPVGNQGSLPAPPLPAYPTVQAQAAMPMHADAMPPSVLQASPQPSMGVAQPAPYVGPSMPVPSGPPISMPAPSGPPVTMSAPAMPAPTIAAPQVVPYTMDGGCSDPGGYIMGGDSGGYAMGCDACGDQSGACGCGIGGGILGGSGLFGGLGTGGGLGGGLGMGLSNLFGNEGYCRPSRIWASGEYLLWWNKGRDLPALVTTSPNGTAQADAGVLGVPGTSILFGNDQYGRDAESGQRYTLGLWLNSLQTLGVGGRLFSLGPQDVSFARSSTGDPILARPFYNVDLAAQDSLLIAYPGINEGGVNVNYSTEISGQDVYLRKLLYSGYCNRIDFIGGYHHTTIDDSLRINHSFNITDPSHVPQGTTIDSRDVFRAENEFNGGEIGLISESEDGALSWNMLAKVSFGEMAQRMSISGASTTTVAGFGSASSDWGHMALPSNIGTYERNEFAFVPEVAMNVRYNLTSQLQLSVGYSMIYWSNVLFAADGVDTSINATQVTGGLVGAERPVFRFPTEEKSFWTQGLSFGLHGRF